MAYAVTMPKAGITVESCIIGKWLKKVGDAVKEGEVLFTYETDKASFECESTAAGEVLDIFFKDGDEVPCFTPVCVVGAKGENYDSLKPAGAAPAAAPAPAQEAAPAPAAAPAAVSEPVKEVAGAKAVTMPKAGITVESCIIGKWLKKVGDAVKEGEVLFTYETDKASFECESTAEGELLDIFFKDGDEVPCFTNVCAVGTKGTDISALKPGGAPAAATAPAAAPEAAAPAAAPEKTVSADGKLKVSPRARALAEKAGVDAKYAEATGPDGRVIERDIRKLMETGMPVKEEPKAAPAPAAAAPAPAPAPAAAAPAAEYEDVKFSGIRKAISKSMMSSLHNMAQLTNHHSFDATAIQAFRKECKAAGGDLAGITLGDMVLYAVSRTILAWPDINANMVDDTTIRRFKHVNLGVAVDTPRGLMVPTIFNADTKSLVEISKEVKKLAEAARTGAISPDLLTGASFTVSNLGSTGVEMFTPVINPPQTAILGVCGIVQRVKEDAGQIKLYPAMGLSLTYDHRAVDGSPASKFVSELVKNLEKFTLLLAK